MNSKAVLVSLARQMEIEKGDDEGQINSKNREIEIPPLQEMGNTGVENKAKCERYRCSPW